MVENGHGRRFFLSLPIYKGADGLNLKRTAVVDVYLVSVFRERLWRGIDRVEQLTEHQFCLVIMDIVLSETDGMDLL